MNKETCKKHSCRKANKRFSMVSSGICQRGNCGECQTSCQSACKTSCGIANQKCENKAR